MRVALFTDSYHEANGIARTTSALEACARRRDVPLLVVHAGPVTKVVENGSVVRLELKRWRPTSFALEHDMRFDLVMWRHASRVAAALRRFAPDVLHFTGPSDIGLLGVFLGYRSNIPMVGSWHTNLHEYASRRLRLAWAPEKVRSKARRWVERQSLEGLRAFYTIPQVVLAPNDEVSCWLMRETGRPTFLMSRGVDTVLFTPDRRRRADPVMNIGYVGRLSPEKNVRRLQAVEAALRADGVTSVRFTIVGEGAERDWLARHMRRAELTGVLRGEALATAYANMDLFIFPSETETVGNVVLEAMASGVTVVAMSRGGPKSIAEHGRSAILCADQDSFVDAVRALVRDAARRSAVGKAARTRALDLSWDRIFDQVWQAYDVAVTHATRERQGMTERIVSVEGN
jgi:glycosyltransferase involved in cell wall biosynthesis